MLFKPQSVPTLLLLGLASSFIVLGNWQLQRADDKDLRISRFSGASRLDHLPVAAEAKEFTRLRLSGRFRLNSDTLADNQVLNGQPGVHVYSAFELDGGQSILVNRGWLALAPDRQKLPVIITPGAGLTISGRIGPIPVPGRQLGAADSMSPGPWPQLVTYPRLEGISEALGTDLYPLVLFLDESSPAGFEGRNWKPVFMTPRRHRAYAFQWFALATVALIGWVLLSLRRGTDL